MERELEVKVLGIDFDALEEKLKSSGARFLGREEQENIRINSEKLKIKSEKGYFRIRKSLNSITNKTIYQLTFKEQVKDLKVRQSLEHTIQFDNLEEMISILKLIGFNIFNRGYKIRKSYSYKNARFDFDTWDKNSYPSPYLEIELKDKNDLEDLLKEFKIDKKNITTKSIAELRKDLGLE